MRKILCLVAVGVLPALASASILTFDQNVPVSDFEIVDQNYGDNITATTMGVFGYGVGAEGFTPDVLVSYGPAGADPSLWSTGYGDLTNILFENADGFGNLEVTFTGTNGFGVSLHSFEMSAFSSAFSSDPTINHVRVLDGNNNELLRMNNVSISESSHTTFSLGSISAPTIVLNFNSANLGGLSDDIAFDNIRFSQFSIPEPTMLALGALGLPMLARRVRR